MLQGPRSPCVDHHCFPLPVVHVEMGILGGIVGAGGPAGLWSPLVTDQGQLPGFRGGCHRLGCRLGCGGAVPGGEPLVPGDLTASCLTPLFIPCPGHAGLSSGPTWDVQVGVPFLQGSPLLQAPQDPRSCPASCTRSWWGHLWPHC